MDNFNELITDLIALGAISLHIIIFSGIVFYFTGYKKQVVSIVGKWGIPTAFLLSLSAMLGSLYYSEIVKLEPCTLCWYQRIFSYPSVLILGFALWKNKKDAIAYSTVLSVIGWFFALYHVFIQFNTDIDSVLCPPNATVSCESIDFLAFGYVTMPVMSLTIFTAVILLLRLASKYEKEN